MNDYQQNQDFRYTHTRNRTSVTICAVCLALSVIILLSTVCTGTFFYLKTKSLPADNAVEAAGYEARIEQLNDRINLLSSRISSDKPQNIPAADTIFSLADTAQTALNSVVCITVTIPSKTYQFGFYTYESGGGYSTGSGVIMTSDGYIVTNYHVVAYFDQYENVAIDVTLHDGTTVPAQLIGADSKNDLAIVKIDTTGLIIEPAVTADSDALRTGQTVIAVGNPLGIEFAGTVTMGIVSAMDRVISEENTSETLIQTDAAINPGNSGGGLFTADGKLVGITSSKIVDTDVEGLGFAIPINYAVPIINDLIEYGYVKDRPATGITGENLTASVARRYGLPEGVIVTSVEKGSGADLAGIKVNDIITEVNGTAVKKMADIQSIDDSLSVGDTIRVTFYRSGQYQTVDLQLLEDRGR